MSDYKNHYADKTILVTGGAGAIGTNLCRTLAELDAKEIIILDNMSAGYEWNIPSYSNITLVQGCITDETILKRCYTKQPDVVYHLAAFFANQNSVDYPAHDLNTNGMGTLLMMQYAQMCGVDRFVYASSGCSIYGSAAPMPLKEDFMSMHLTTPYQITKMLGELYGNFFHHHFKLPVVKTRFFNSYGPGEVPGQYRNVIPNFIFWALSGIELPFTGTGEETRDFTFVGDLVNALLRAGYFEAAIGEEMNLASARETNILNMAERVNELCGNKAGVRRAPARIWDTKKRLLASIDKANDLLGYEPEMDFDEGLGITIDWFKANWSKIKRDAEFPPGGSSAVQGLLVKKEADRVAEEVKPS